MRIKLDGFLSGTFRGDLAPPMDLGLAAAMEYCAEEVPIHDARPIQAEAASEADFFARHGFALLEHETKVRDWTQQQLRSLYMRELETLIRDRLLRGRRIKVLPGLMGLRRGPNQRYYAKRVHADGPLTAERYVQNVGAVGGDEAIAWWSALYAREDIAGFVSIGFWRTINLRQPLRHMPLAMCDPNTIDRRDVVPTTSTIVALGGRTTHHLVLRHQASQQWSYYPRMTVDEVVAMKACEFWKDDPQAHPQNVFHAAFRDPTAPADAERRQSFDHRVGVMILRD